MTTAAPAVEDFIPLIRSGDALIARLVLSGWQTAAPTLRTWSDRGRMWGRIFADTSGDRFELYRRSGLASGDRICHGLIASGTATLAAANSSGITGTVDVPSYTSGDTHLFDVIISYGDESDLVSVYAGAANELDSSSKWEAQGTRFETLLLETKRLIDSLLWARIKDAVGVDRWGRPNLGYLSDPRQYARVHALLCASAIYDARAAVGRNGIDAARMEMARTKRSQALEEFNLIQPILDSNRDAVAEGYESPGSIVIRRA